MNNRVTHVYAFIADGEDSFMAMQMGGEHFPMVASGRNPATLEHMKRSAARIAKITGRTIRLVKFAVPEELETFEP